MLSYEFRWTVLCLTLVGCTIDRGVPRAQQECLELTWQVPNESSALVAKPAIPPSAPPPTAPRKREQFPKCLAWVPFRIVYDASDRPSGTKTLSLSEPDTRSDPHRDCCHLPHEEDDSTLFEATVGKAIGAVIAIPIWIVGIGVVDFCSRVSIERD